MPTDVQILVGVAVAFLIWRAVQASPEGRVLLDQYVQKNGVCFRVKLYASGKSTSEKVADSYCA